MRCYCFIGIANWQLRNSHLLVLIVLLVALVHVDIGLSNLCLLYTSDAADE